MKYFILFWLLFCQHIYAAGMGYGQLDFKASEPGSYLLHPLGEAKNGDILTVNNKKVKLHDLFHDKIVLLGFIYLSCNDVNGCPLTIFVVSQINAEIAKTEGLSDHVRLLSLSFDPQRDKPAILKQHGVHLGADGGIWHLATTQNEQQLQPILEKYNQPIQKIYDKDGKPTGQINHILRVFLIDKNKVIRNIYTNSFLHRDIVLNDIKTLLLEENKNMTFNRNSNVGSKIHSH